MYSRVHNAYSLSGMILQPITCRTSLPFYVMYMLIVPPFLLFFKNIDLIGRSSLFFVSLLQVLKQNSALKFERIHRCT